MKAIKITKAIKNLNPNLGGEANTIYSGAVPKRLIRNEGTVFGYDNREDLQTADGWKEIVNPTIGENQRKGKLIETTDGFTYKVIDLTAEEIEAKGIIVMPKSEFKMALLLDYNITNGNVETLFNTLIDNSLATVQQVEVMRIMWFERVEFKNNTPELYQFAAMMNITEDDIKQIFLDYANL